MKYINKAQHTWYGGNSSGGPVPPTGCCYDLITVAGLQALATTNSMVTGTFYQITDITGDWQGVFLAEDGTNLSKQGQGIYQNSLFTEAYYDLMTNTLYKIYDPTYNNEVEGSLNIAAFIWNNPNWNNNKILNNSSFTDGSVSILSFSNNTIDGSTVILTGSDIQSIVNNVIEGGSNLTIQTSIVNGNISNNHLSGTSNITLIDSDTADITTNGVKEGSTISLITCSIGGQISSNNLGSVSSLLCTTVVCSNISGNHLLSNSTITLDTLTTASIQYNSVQSGSSMTIGNVVNGNISNNNISFNSNITAQPANITGNLKENGVSHNSSIDLSDATLQDFLYNIVENNSQFTLNSLTAGGLLIENNTIRQDSYINLSNATITDNFSFNSVTIVSYIDIGSSQVDLFTRNVVSDNSNITFSGVTATSCICRRNNVSEDSRIIFSGINTTLGTIEDNQVFSSSQITDFSLSGCDVPYIAANSVGPSGDMFLFQCDASQIIANMIDVGTLYFGYCSASGQKIEANKCIRGFIVLGNGGGPKTIIKEVKSNTVGGGFQSIGNLVIFTSGTVGNTIYDNSILGGSSIRLVGTSSCTNAIQYNSFDGYSNLVLTNSDVGVISGNNFKSASFNALGNAISTGIINNSFECLTTGASATFQITAGVGAIKDNTMSGSSTFNILGSMTGGDISQNQIEGGSTFDFQNTSIIQGDIKDNRIFNSSNFSIIGSSVETDLIGNDYFSASVDINNSQISNFSYNYIYYAAAIFGVGDNKSIQDNSFVNGSYEFSNFFGDIQDNTAKDSAITFNNGSTANFKYNNILSNTNLNDSLGALDGANFIDNYIEDCSATISGTFQNLISKNVFVKSNITINLIDLGPSCDIISNLIYHSTVSMLNSSFGQFTYQTMLSGSSFTIDGLETTISFSWNSLSENSVINISPNTTLTDDFKYNILKAESNILLASTVSTTIQYNNLHKSTLNFNDICTIGEIKNNELNYSEWNFNACAITTINSNISTNDEWTISADDNNSNYDRNVSNSCKLDFRNGSSLEGCGLQNIVATITTNHQEQSAIQSGYNNFSVDLDLSAVFNPITHILDIPSGFADYVGVFNLTNGTATDRVETIKQTPTQWEYRIYNKQNNGNIVRFRKNVGNIKFHTGVSGADIDLKFVQDFVQFQDYAPDEYLIIHNTY